MITTHVLDTALGKPAVGVKIRLDLAEGAGWKSLGEGTTDGDGRLRTLLAPGSQLEAGAYRLRFETGEYFSGLGVAGFFPTVDITFIVRESGGHYHVPLLLSPFGYSTYRGS